MKRIFANGCFDILHSGHIHTLEEARSKGDRLIVGVNSDDSVSRLKGQGRPLVPLRDRIAVLRGLRCVDEVIPFWEDTPEKLIYAIRPDIIVKGSDWRGRPVAGEDISGLEHVSNLPGFSTTDLVKKIIMLYNHGLIDENGASR